MDQVHHLHVEGKKSKERRVRWGFLMHAAFPHGVTLYFSPAPLFLGAFPQTPGLSARGLGGAGRTGAARAGAQAPRALPQPCHGCCLALGQQGTMPDFLFS